jgi:hypothetical protein
VCLEAFGSGGGSLWKKLIMYSEKLIIFMILRLYNHYNFNQTREPVIMGGVKKCMSCKVSGGPKRFGNLWFRSIYKSDICYFHLNTIINPTVFFLKLKKNNNNLQLILSFL